VYDDATFCFYENCAQETKVDRPLNMCYNVLHSSMIIAARQGVKAELTALWIW